MEQDILIIDVVCTIQFKVFRENVNDAELFSCASQWNRFTIFIGQDKLMSQSVVAFPLP